MDGIFGGTSIFSSWRWLRGATKTLACFAVCNVAAFATADDWINIDSDANSFYQNIANWDSGSVPGSTGTAIFNQGETYSVFWDSLTGGVSPDIGLIRFQSGDVTFSNLNNFSLSYTVNGSGGGGLIDDFLIIGSGTSWTNDGINISVNGGATIGAGTTATIDGSHVAGSEFNVLGTGFDVAGTFNVFSGAQASSISSTIGRSAGTSGSATVDGTNSHWDAGTLTVGDEGSGQLFISNTGVVESETASVGTIAGASGLVQITGTNSSWSVTNPSSSSVLQVGLAGDGQVVVDGGSLSTNLTAIGVQAGSNGTINVKNSGTWMSGSNVFVGFGADTGTTHEIVVESQGSFQGSGAVIIGANPSTNGSITVRDSGSSFSTTGSITVGQSGVGTLDVINSATLTAQDVSVGLNLGSTGTVNVLGNGSFNVNNSLTIGGSGAGTLTADTGGTVSAGGTANIGDQGNLILDSASLTATGGITNSGTIQMTGSSMLVGSVSNVGAGRIENAAGIATIQDDVTHNGTGIETSAGASTVFQGEVTGTGQFEGTGEVVFEAGLSPGNSPGTMTFFGDVTLAASSQTNIEIGGILAGEYDSLSIAGDFTIDGILDVSMFNGFSPGESQQFVIADVGGALTGTWAGMPEGAEVGEFGGQTLFITYTDAVNGGNGVTLFSVPEPGSMVVVLALAGGIAVRRRRNTV